VRARSSSTRPGRLPGPAPRSLVGNTPPIIRRRQFTDRMHKARMAAVTRTGSASGSATVKNASRLARRWRQPPADDRPSPRGVLDQRTTKAANKKRRDDKAGEGERQARRQACEPEVHAGPWSVNKTGTVGGRTAAARPLMAGRLRSRQPPANGAPIRRQKVTIVRAGVSQIAAKSSGCRHAGPPPSGGSRLRRAENCRRPPFHILADSCTRETPTARPGRGARSQTLS
jgi:hypothetical protein